MSQADLGVVKVCPECGAENIPLAGQCWMCHGDLTQVAPLELVTAEAISHVPKFAPSASFFPVLTLLAIVVAALVAWALGEQSLGILVLYGAIVIPALIAASIRVGRKRLRGERVGWGEAILTGLIATAVVHGALGLLALAGFVALFVMCVFHPPYFGH
jgi:hypothetical protein